MRIKKGAITSILITILAFFIGLLGIAALISIGEALNNSIATFAVVSIPLALLAGFLSWVAPASQWSIASALCGPVAVICFMGAWSDPYLIAGAIWTIALTFAGSYIGARRKSPDTPPPTTPQS